MTREEFVEILGEELAVFLDGVFEEIGDKEEDEHVPVVEI